MSNDELTLLAIQGFIANLPKDDKGRVEECIAEIRAVLANYPPEWRNLAIALIGAEMQLESE